MRILVRNATRLSNSWNTSAGVLNPSLFLGLLFNLFWIILISSLANGLAKYVVLWSCSSICAFAANSLMLSKVSVLTLAAIGLSLSTMARLTNYDVLLVMLAMTPYPLLRSTIVTTAPLWLAPITVSHSQWPTCFLASICKGRSLKGRLLGICPRRSRPPA